MVGGRDRVIFTQCELTELLHNYKSYKREQKIIGCYNEKIDFLEHCLEQLEDYEKKLIANTMIENISIRKYAKISGFSRNFIVKQQQLLIAQLTKFFNIKFSFDKKNKC